MDRKPLVTMEQWGKDHWSTFAYAETCLETGGYLDMRKMRMDGVAYPTRLKCGEVLGHTDLDCLFDAQDLHLLTISRATQRDGRGEIKAATYLVEFTDRGFELAAALRKHKAQGGNFAGFDPMKVNA